MTACVGKNEVDFTWSPQEPRIGQVVKFSNASQKGSEWAWSFGDNATSVSKNPTHVYTRVGTYTVRLEIDGHRQWTCTKTIHVHDSLPTIACRQKDCYMNDTLDSISVPLFRRLVFEAQYYNPYRHKVAYAWSLDESPLLEVPDSLHKDTIGMRFAEPQAAYHLMMTLFDKNTDSTLVTHRYIHVRDTAGPAVVCLSAGQKYYQRHYFSPAIYESARPTEAAFVNQVLSLAQDQEASYNGQTYTLATVSSIVSAEVKGFAIRAGRIYYRTAAGLFVSDINGQNVVAIAESECTYVTIDEVRGLLYFATSEGLHAMPLIQSPNNRFDPATLKTVNTLDTITRIAFVREAKLRQDY